MPYFENLIELLADARSKQRHIRFIDGEHDESTLSFAELWQRALALLGVLQSRGMRAGDELVVFCNSNESFVVAYWAAILGGIVPVPVAVGISDEHRYKLFRILQQLRRATLFTETDLLNRLLEFSRQQDLLSVTAILETRSALIGDTVLGASGELHSPAPGDLAFIQYSSGSTSDPKGVCLTHRNLCTNVRAIVEATHWMQDDVSLSWMPLTHDMGLIGYHLSVMAAGMNHAVMDTSLFVRRPLLWISKANELRASQLCSPNFGYKHFLKMFERKGMRDLDLSCVRLILNGAEPISYELCEQFLTALAPHGLRRSAMFPVYGLAEATVGVTIGNPGDEYSRIFAHRHSLRIGAPYAEAQSGDADAVSFVKVGRPIRDVELRLVDDADTLIAAGCVGNIQLKGASVTERIYGDPEATAGLFTADGWLRTGDCGVMVDGQLVITGRSKDIIIVNGQNYYPHDLEEIAAQIEGLELGKVVVAGATPTGSQTEELLVFVLYRQEPDGFRAIASELSNLIAEHTGLAVDHVIPVPRIPKTTSGKVQRVALLNAYLDGEFDAVVKLLSPPDADSDADPLVAELILICSAFAKERSIGGDDNLFEIGVSSLTLTEMVLAIDERYPGKLDISDLFDYPTLREVADFLRRNS
ncbi:MAG: non-ribosomal peptide synthetase [Gammaproteobacteria bacterium]|nr:non-ribosomal peptide synthetase [Gammaproteobacteria bacterium]MDH5322149.1 non-ribosomal peptide synthetase [Gammaproteobacteria bacterium]